MDHLVPISSNERAMNVLSRIVKTIDYEAQNKLHRALNKRVVLEPLKQVQGQSKGQGPAVAAEHVFPDEERDSLSALHPFLMEDIERAELSLRELKDLKEYAKVKLQGSGPGDTEAEDTELDHQDACARSRPVRRARMAGINIFQKSSEPVPEHAPCTNANTGSHPNNADQSLALPSVFTLSQQQQQQQQARKGNHGAADDWTSPPLTPHPLRPNSPRPTPPPRKPPTVAGVLDMLRQRFSLPTSSVANMHEAPPVAASGSSFNAHQKQQSHAPAEELSVTRSSQSVPSLPALTSSKHGARQGSLEISVPPPGSFLTGGSPTIHSGPPSTSVPAMPSNLHSLNPNCSHSGPLPSVSCPLSSSTSPKPPRKGAPMIDAQLKNRSKSGLLAVHANPAAKQQAVRRASLAVTPGIPGRETTSSPIPALSLPDAVARTQFRSGNVGSNTEDGGFLLQ